MMQHVSQQNLTCSSAKFSVRHKQQSGQSVLVAIAVMFLLAFVAALFITIVARNFDRVNRNSQVLDADYYAQAGIHFADQMLTNSTQGADWRPPLTCQLATSVLAANPLTPDESNTYGLISAGLKVRNTLDPDGFWLDQGFSRYNTSGGRFLLRVTYGYDPTNGTGSGSIYGVSAGEPNGKYIKIESIGRTGEIDDTKPEDPTVFFAQPIRLHAEEIAFKPIGLVDYSRFITNKDNRPDTFNLGVPSSIEAANGTNPSQIVTSNVFDFNDYSAGSGPQITPYPVVTIYGDPNAAALTSQNPGSPLYEGAGGSLRCNGNLRLYGANVAFLDGSSGEDWEVAGNLSFDGYNSYANYSLGGAPAGAVNPTQLTVVGNNTLGNPINQTGSLANPANSTPSNVASITGVNIINGTPGFDSIGGLIRDGSPDNDVNNIARSIKRLNPPSLDTINPSDNLTRYGEICATGTYSSAIQVPGSVPAVYGGPYKPETITAPATVYIDNFSDSQPETSNVTSVATTLRDDWINGYANGSKTWTGPFYNPPGATIVFGPERFVVNGSIEYAWGFTVTRSDNPTGAAGAASSWSWTNPNGPSPVTPLASSTVAFVYGAMPSGFVFDSTKPIYFLNADNPNPGAATAGQTTTNNDIVIYAKGNVRVRGIISPTSAQYGDSGGNYAGTGSLYPHHVTVVSDQIAYIDGSIMKGGANYSALSAGAGGNVYVPAYSSQSSIALLAQRYVCVNTTQFMAGSLLRNDLNTNEAASDSLAIDFSSDNTLTEEYDFPPVNYNTTSANVPTGVAQAVTHLYTSEYSATNSSADGDINLSVDQFNSASAQTQTLGTSYTTPAGTTFAGGVGTSVSPNRGFVMSNFFPDSQALTPPTTASRVDITFSKDALSQSDWQLERAALLPSDVRIEAVLYAQNNSFFVIPGPWFNSDGQDTMDKYVTSFLSGAPHRDQNYYLYNQVTPTNDPTNNIDPSFPFYGQPVDMKITIDGSIVENVTADISDQQAWMTKWGWIPRFEGDPDLSSLPGATGPFISPHSQAFFSNGMALPGIATDIAVPTTPSPQNPPQWTPAQVPGVGLTITYDSMLGTGSYRSSITAVPQYIRLDQFGRPLPVIPNLPVSPDLLYSGQASDNSLVQ